jgi:hypothetical protein
MLALMLKGSVIKGINTYHYTFILNTNKFVNEQGVKLGGVSENTLSNIIYRIRVFQEVKNCKN